jgi:predicted nucleic acid-binding protein
MYLVGAPHANKDSADASLTRLITAGERFVTDAEVFQEILHRYVAINRRDAIQPCFDALRALVTHVYPVDMDDILRAQSLVLDATALFARDAIHVAVMRRNKIKRVLSFDRGFDGLAGIERL